MFFLLYKHTDDGVFDDFPKNSDYFPKISEDFPKLFQARRTFPNIFRKFPKISERLRRLSRKTRRCLDDTPNESKYNLRDKLDISEIIDIFTCEDIVSFLLICYHSVYHWLLYNKADLQTELTCLSSDKVSSKATPMFLALSDRFTRWSPTRILSKDGRGQYFELITSSSVLSLINLSLLQDVIQRSVSLTQDWTWAKVVYSGHSEQYLTTFSSQQNQ